MKQAVLYVRVSSKEQKEEGYSVPAQRKLLQAYAVSEGFEVVREYEEVETAKQAGRTQFGQMVAFLKRRKNIKHVLVEKTDRLYRNFRDLVTIDELGRNIHFVKEGQIIGPDAKSSDKLIHSIKVALAKNYVDNLSEETSKGLREKAAQGLWPSYSPLGYLNNRDKGTIYPDPERAPKVRRLFEIYGEGRVSLSELVKVAHELGLRSRGGNRIYKSAIHVLLKNPIYMGDFVWGGVTYSGKHEPIIPPDLFQRVQEIVHGRHRSQLRKHDFAFRGLVRCGKCGCAITGQIQKGKYVYYRCTRGKKNCQEKPIREEDLARQLGEPLKWLRVTPERQKWIVRALRESSADQRAYAEKERERLTAALTRIDNKIERLYDDRLSGIIDTEFWKKKYGELQAERARTQEELTRLDESRGVYLENAEQVLKLSQEAHSLYVTRNPHDQRELVDLLLSNCTLMGKRVSAELRKPFDVIADGAQKERRLRARSLPDSLTNRMWLPRWDLNSDPSA